MARRLSPRAVADRSGNTSRGKVVVPRSPTVSSIPSPTDSFCLQVTRTLVALATMILALAAQLPSRRIRHAALQADILDLVVSLACQPGLP
jgi:hypothetical protein